MTTPGRKRVYRIINAENGHAEGDYIALDNENIQQEERLKMFHPIHTYISKFVTNFTAKELHESIIENGNIVYEEPTIQEIQKYVQENLHLLWCEYKRTMNPEEYPVDLSQVCWDNKMASIQAIKEKVSQRI